MYKSSCELGNAFFDTLDHDTRLACISNNVSRAADSPPSFSLGADHMHYRLSQLRLCYHLPFTMVGGDGVLKLAVKVYHTIFRSLKRVKER